MISPSGLNVNSWSFVVSWYLYASILFMAQATDLQGEDGILSMTEINDQLLLGLRGFEVKAIPPTSV